MSVVKTLMRCIDYATRKHRLQLRKDEVTPFINHPIGLACILTEEANIFDPDIIQAAILHKVIEDTNTTFEEVQLVFGPHIANIIDELTDDISLPTDERKWLQVKNSCHCSYEAKLIKLANKLYNLRDHERGGALNWRQTFGDEYVAWCKKVVDQLRGTNRVLEMRLDEIFKKYNI